MPFLCNFEAIMQGYDQFKLSSLSLLSPNSSYPPNCSPFPPKIDRQKRRQPQSLLIKTNESDRQGIRERKEGRKEALVELIGDAKAVRQTNT